MFYFNRFEKVCTKSSNQIKSTFVIYNCTWMKMFLWHWAVQWSWFARVNALCNPLRKTSWEVAASFLGNFWVGIVSHCVQQCVLNLELRGSTNATTVAVVKIERGWRVDKKVFKLHQFLADQKIMSSWKICILGHPVAWPTIYCLLQDSFCLKVGSVKFTNLLSPPSIVKKVCTRSKSSQGT